MKTIVWIPLIFGFGLWLLVELELVWFRFSLIIDLHLDCNCFAYLRGLINKRSSYIEEFNQTIYGLSYLKWVLFEFFFSYSNTEKREGKNYKGWSLPLLNLIKLRKEKEVEMLSNIKWEAVI